MKKLYFLIIALFCCLSSSFSGNNKPVDFNGTWCAGSDGLILTFFAKDSLLVGSSSDESIKGNGVYKRTDTTFSATVKNGDVTMAMKYRYLSKSTDTVSAQAIYFRVDGDSVQVPEEWVDMTRCGSKQLTVPAEVKNNNTTSKSKK